MLDVAVGQLENRLMDLLPPADNMLSLTLFAVLVAPIRQNCHDSVVIYTEIIQLQCYPVSFTT